MEDLRRYFAEHHGVITRGRARMLGLTNDQIRRRLRTGEFLRVGPGVFRLATSPETWPARARAAALSARGLIDGPSALRTWRVDGCSRFDGISVAVGPGRQPRASGATVHRVGDLELLDGRLVNAIPVTGLAQAVIGASAVLPPSDLESIVDAVIRQRLVSLEELRLLIERTGTRGRKGAGTLKRLVADRDPGIAVPDSRFNRLVGRLLVDAGLPEPHFEYEVRYKDRLIGRVDLAYPVARILIECDSARWHQSRASFIADPRRRNRLVLAGYQVLNFTWADYTDRPGQIQIDVAAALEQRLCAPVSY